MIQYVVLFIAVLGSASYGFASPANKAMEEADAYLRNGQYLEAVGAYQDISNLSPDPEMKVRAILRIGDIYSYFLNNYDQALEHYSIVIQKYGSSEHTANACFNSGMILYERNRYKDALKQFTTYLQRYPGGDRRETAEFMIETCSRPPPSTKGKKPAFKMAKDETIRVLIATGVRDIHIGSSSPFEVKDGVRKETLIKVKNTTIDISGGTLKLNGESLPHHRLLIIPSEKDILSLNGNRYRGNLMVQRSSHSGMDVINVLDVEAYLYGVVPKEMSPLWHPEALKAQAVAARTYALYQKDKRRDRDYDVICTTKSQVYGGVGAESENSNKAVDETKGMVLLHNDQLALTYFHANSGGMTEDAKRVWTADVPYLRSVRDDYSMKATNCSWHLSLHVNTLRNYLNKNGLGIASIERVIPGEVSPSGRVMKVKLFHGGREITLNGNDFRVKIDPALVRSTLFTLSNEGNEVRFEGKGYGHGVGMSQWGAYFMAREGYSYGDILRHYYYGVELR